MDLCGLWRADDNDYGLVGCVSEEVVQGAKVNVQHLMLGRDFEGADVLVGEDVGGGEGEERGVVVDGKAAEVAQDGKY